MSDGGGMEAPGTGTAPLARTGGEGSSETSCPKPTLGHRPRASPNPKAAGLGSSWSWSGEVAVTCVPSLCSGSLSRSLPLSALPDRLVW